MTVQESDSRVGVEDARPSVKTDVDELERAIVMEITAVSVTFDVPIFESQAHRIAAGVLGRLLLSRETAGDSHQSA